MAWPADSRAVPVDDLGPKATVTDPAEAVRKRRTDKVGRVKKGVQQWAASRRNPSVILRAMQEKVKPLLDAGKVVEAPCLSPDGRSLYFHKRDGDRFAIDRAARNTSVK